MPALLQRLSDADDASVAENAENIVDKFMFNPVQLHKLLVEEPDQRLRHGQPNGLHE